MLIVNPDKYYLSDTENLSDLVEIVIKTFENHTSVQAIKQNILVDQNFHFSNTDVINILEETAVLNKKNGTFGNISTKRLKDVPDICTSPLIKIQNKKIITQKVFQIILN